jgi:hypothetical protein
MDPSSATRTSLRAQADQTLSATGLGLDLMVEVARAQLDTGKDRIDVVAALFTPLALTSALGAGEELLRGFALAVVRLAELPAADPLDGAR